MNIKLGLLLLLLSARLLATEQSGQLVTVVSSGGGSSYGIADWYSHSVSYVNGGITFTFPNGLFIDIPVVTVGIETGDYDNTLQYTALITVIDEASVTIRVNTASGEAATDEVKVHVWAVGGIE